MLHRNLGLKERKVIENSADDRKGELLRNLFRFIIKSSAARMTQAALLSVFVRILFFMRYCFRMTYAAQHNEIVY